MPRNPKVSILLNCYNGEKFLKSAIDSALEQTFGDWELIFLTIAQLIPQKKFFSYKDNRLKYFERKSKPTLSMQEMKQSTMHPLIGLRSLIQMIFGKRKN